MSRTPVTRRGRGRGRHYQMKAHDLQGSTLESDDEMQFEPSTSQKSPIKTLVQPLTIEMKSEPGHAKFAVIKSGDDIKHVSEQIRSMHMRVMAMEEKIDSIHRMLDVIYKSAPTSLSSGPKPNILTVTNWGD
uniref:Uncharacterized protein n=1 Tax=Nasutitermes takasagoensis chuvirus 1 TaxID=3133479 RepID=A0AAT9JFL2_9VIRU